MNSIDLKLDAAEEIQRRLYIIKKHCVLRCGYISSFLTIFLFIKSN